MATKKKRTPAQIAATKKLVAANKKRAAAKKKKSPAKKKKIARKKVAVTAKSRATGKAPSARLKRRRAANKKPGYYPNPIHKNYYVVKVASNGTYRFYTGENWTDNQNHGAVWHNQSMAKTIANSLAKLTGDKIGVLTDEKK